jgi:AcrR family transcriptional regulator
MKARIALVAERLFREEGYGAVSMRRIAEATGCSPMTLYRYFDGKIDVLRSLWGGVFETLFTTLARNHPRGIPPADRLEAISQDYLGYWLERPDHYRLVFMSDGVSQSEVGGFVASDPAPARFALFAEAIADALDRQDDEDLRARQDFLICSLQGIAHSLITISAQPWTAPRQLVARAVKATLAD